MNYDSVEIALAEAPPELLVGKLGSRRLWTVCLIADFLTAPAEKERLNRMFREPDRTELKTVIAGLPPADRDALAHICRRLYLRPRVWFSEGQLKWYEAFKAKHGWIDDEGAEADVKPVEDPAYRGSGGNTNYDSSVIPLAEAPPELLVGKLRSRRLWTVCLIADFLTAPAEKERLNRIFREPDRTELKTVIAGLPPADRDAVAHICRRLYLRPRIWLSEGTLKWWVAFKAKQGWTDDDGDEADLKEGGQ